MMAKSGDTKKKKLPPVKVGNVRIPRYILADGRMMIAYPTATQKRKCETFANHAEGTAEAEKKARELHNGGSEAQIFTSADRADFSQAKKDVAPYASTVHVATAEWAAAKKEINGRHTLAEVVKAGLQILTRKPRPVHQIVAEFKASKELQDLQGRYWDGMIASLERFAVAFPCDIREIKAPEIQKYFDGELVGETRVGGLRKLNGEPVGPRRRDNVLKEVRSLFQFARLHGYLPDEISEARKVPLIDERGGPISYFTIPEARLILEHVREQFIPFVALMLFNGFRVSELVKDEQSTRRKDPLRWDDFDWEDNEIIVRDVTSKIDRPRKVPLHPVTREFLTNFIRPSGYVCVQGRTDREFGKNGLLEKRINKALKKAPVLNAVNELQLEIPGVTDAPDNALITEFQWRHNALRHSYGSYRGSQLKNIDELEEEMGTSKDMIHKNYRNPRPRREADAWFAIRPAKDPIIVPFHAAISA